jgi:Protein of unknown function (DUF3987)
MIPDRTTFRTVSRAEPCAICGKTHKCSRGADGLILCGRPVEPAPAGFVYLGRSKGDEQFGMYRAEGDPVIEARQYDHANGNGHAKGKRASPIDWRDRAEKYAKAFTPELRRELAESLGLPEAALARLSLLGWHADEQAWTFPEVDGAGNVRGLNRRYRDGSKRMLPGGRRGLTVPADWDMGGPILLVEGASDTLILHALGLTAIGRPNNTGGSELLAEMLKDVGPERQIVVVGEFDPKSDSGLWPGRDGAIQTAEKLAAALNRPISWCLPPDDAKDSREWTRERIGEHREDADAWADLGQRFWTGCEGRLNTVSATNGPPNDVIGAACDEISPAVPFSPFPLVALPEPIRSYVDAGAAAINCDPSFIALPMLSMLAGAIGNSRRVVVKRGWSEPAILWTAIIGESGTTKSPAVDLARDYPSRRQAEARKRFESELAEYLEEMARHKLAIDDWKKNPEDDRPEEPEKPILERALVDDTTIEALGPLLMDNWRGTLILRDELAGWLGGFDRYSKSPKGGGEAAKWIEMHGGRSITIDRRTGEPRTLFVPRAAVSIGGSIQPGIIRKLLTAEHRESGLLARLLMAYPPRRPRKWTDAEIDDSIRNAVQSVYDQLWLLHPLTVVDGDPRPVMVMLSSSARQEFVAFVNAHGDEQFQLDGELASAWSKLEGYAVRLALIHHLVRCASGERPDPEAGIDIESIRAGIDLVRWFGEEDRRIYAMLNEDRGQSERRELVELIRRHGGTITARRLQQVSRRFPNAEAATAALAGLVDAKLAEWVPGANVNGQGGRPTWFVQLTS